MSVAERISNFGFRNFLITQGYSSESTQIKDFIIDNMSEFPEVIKMVTTDDEVANAVISRLYERGKVVDVDGPMSGYIKKVSSAEGINVAHLMSWNSRASDSLKVLSMLPEYDWKELFDQVIAWVSHRRYYGDAAGIVFEATAKQHPKHFLEVAESRVFSDKPLPYQIRSIFYRALIQAGLLNKKFARKMRSDSSEYASEAAIDTLLKMTEDTYADLDQLLITFSDSKHQTVVRKMAEGLPKHLLYSLLGTQFHWLKNIIDRRMGQDDE